ncbi:MAG: hypothetical protein Q9219_003149 [cf. Caloplaca sp. 3 TL-2023]
MTTSTTSSTSLQGKVAIITGGSRGIGAQIALELASRGARVAITYTSPSSSRPVADLVEKINSNNTTTSPTAAISIQADLRHPSAPSQIITQTLSAFGPTIHILINNAGVDFFKPFREITSEDFAHVYDLNVRAVLFMSQAVAPHLPSSSSSPGSGGAGRIINIGSVGARCGFKELSLYCSSKAAVEGLSRVLAAELGGKGHTVNTVNPGPVATDMLEKIPAEIVEMQKRQTPVEGRLGTVDDVAQVVAWLAEEGSRWVTGQTVSASGGWAMY